MMTNKLNFIDFKLHKISIVILQKHSKVYIPDFEQMLTLYLE